MKNTSQELRQKWVRFRICDVYIPAPEKILLELHGADVLQGKVLDISESGSQEQFAVIEVEELENSVIVPVRLILNFDE
jgi:hypothetical protein